MYLVVCLRTDYLCIKGVLHTPFPNTPKPLKAMGVNLPNNPFSLVGPQYMVDILCDPANGTKNDVNISTTAALQAVGYRIGGNMVLTHWGQTSNIEVGVGAGNPGVGVSNVFVGNQAGFTSGPLGQYSVLVGYQAGLVSQSDGSTMVGSQSGLSLTNGDFNTFYGNLSGNQTTNGGDNVFIGATSGTINTVGSSNVTLGVTANQMFNNLNGTCAIGTGALVTTDNNMILGNNGIKVGIGMSGILGGPTNKLEISNYSTAAACPSCAQPASISTCLPLVGTGASGLQFRDLTSASTPNTNCPGQPFLTTDANGNVILMAQPTASGGIGTCSSPTTLTAANGAIDMANLANFYFLGNGSGTALNNVSIGYTSACPTPNGKLDVLQSSGSTSGSVGVYVKNTDLPGNFTTPPIGIQSIIPPLSCANLYPAVAGWFESEYCNGSGATISYSIFVPPASITGNSTGIVSIGYPFGFVPTGTLFAGSAAAPTLLYVAGGINGIGFYTASDRKFKTNLNPLSNAISIINNIKPYYYYYDTVNFPKNHFPSGKQIGFIAQNVDSVLPEIVEATDSGYAMDYSKITPLLLAGIQQQQGTIDSLKNILNSMQNCLTLLCNSNSPHQRRTGNSGDSNQNDITNIQDVTLASANAPLLYQNVPNPFSANTKINYYLPEGTVGATMVFYDSYGNKMKEVQLSQTGNGTLNINPENLNAGIYSYSLVVNGKVIDTKRMILQK